MRAAMKLNSKFFDRLRVKPDENRLLRESCPVASRQGCTEPGLYPAPKGRGHEGQYHRFCLDHVREYNKSYNYFSGLPDEAVAKHQKDDMIGHRPTWSSASTHGRVTAPQRRSAPQRLRPPLHHLDPFGLFPERAGADQAAEPEPADPQAPSGNACASSIEDTATKAEIKARFKELVKRLHPDHNKGDRRSEDKLREVIQAYNYLRQAGLA